MIASKLPTIGTAIFSQMSALAQQHQAINLSQGFPEFDGPEQLKKDIQRYIDRGYNQYAPMPGVAELRQAIAQLTQQWYQRSVNPDTDITITSGATE